MEAIERREGLRPDEFWYSGNGPEDWNELNRQYDKNWDTKIEETSRELGLDDMADLLRNDRSVYDDQRVLDGCYLRTLICRN